MEPLFLLLRELIECAVPAGNKRGELHALVDELAAGLGAEEAAAKAPAGAKAVPPRLPTPAAFLPPVTVPGGPAQP